MLMSGEALKAAAGGKGRAVELLHCVGDLLWALAPGSPVPNPGYTGEEVQPWSGVLPPPPLAPLASRRSVVLGARAHVGVSTDAYEAPYFGSRLPIPVHC